VEYESHGGIVSSQPLCALDKHAASCTVRISGGSVRLSALYASLTDLKVPAIPLRPFSCERNILPFEVSGFTFLCVEVRQCFLKLHF
jgi:hypothetical protein